MQFKSTYNLYKFLIFCFVIFTLVSCNSSTNPDQIVNKSIEKYGGKIINNSKIEFDFRGKHYKIKRNYGNFLYERVFLDSTEGIIREGFTNDSTYKEINGLTILLDDEKTAKIRNSINQIIYFNLLPFKLNDKSVIKTYVGEKEINGKNYHKIKVTFKNENEKNHQDTYIYWFDKNNYNMDYFAYYYPSGEVGSRFRSLKKNLSVNGIIFSDWKNYTNKEIGENIESYDQLFIERKLKKVSDIEITNITVEPF